ncbi:hypothetical protein AC1031_008520 [Aphanomyces cochlioides]|nr:hypothetical protein AC1031_008520 [Aphanomyces cochlioides]
MDATPHDESFVVVSMIADEIDLFIPTSNGANPLNAPGPASDSSDSQKRPKCINLSRKRQRDEIEFLRIKVVEMEKHLTKLRKDKPENSSTTEPAIDKTNETLKEQLRQQIEFGKSLQSLLAKRPQLTLLPTLISDQWKVKRFPVDPVIRKQLAMEICQQQYHQISTMLREFGIQDYPGRCHSYVPCLASQNEDLILQVIVCRKEPIDHLTIGRMAWSLLTGSLSVLRRSHGCLEMFNSNTMYVRMEQRWNGFVNQTNLLLKRHIEPTRFIVTMRSILEDDVFPYDQDAFVLNRCAWLIFEQGDTGSVMKFFQKSTLPMVQASYAAQHLGDEVNNPEHGFYRVGNVTDATLLSIKEMVSDFGNSLSNLVEALTGQSLMCLRRLHCCDD